MKLTQHDLSNSRAIALAPIFTALLAFIGPSHALAAQSAVVSGTQAWFTHAASMMGQMQSSLVGLGVIAGLLMLSWMMVRLTKPSKQRQSNGVLERLPDAVALFDAKGRLSAVNTKLLKLLPLEVSSEELDDITTSDLYAQLSPDNIAIERARNDARNSLHDPDSTISFELPSYGPRSLMIKERPTEDGGTAITVYGTQRQATRVNDPLTALPNRTRLLSELAQRCTRTKDELALIIVDLRSFRQINDSYGREAGDELLKQTGICLQHCMPDDALIARTAGDEFAVLIEFDNDGRTDIERRVTRFLTTLRHGLNVRAMNVPARASVGIAFAPEHGNTVSKLLESADSACAHAKQLGNNTLVVYNSEQQNAAKRRHKMEIGLQQAIKNNELSLQYQPQVDIKTLMTSGTEALLRWKSPEYGQVSPAEFIYVAEQTGIITQLGIWVLKQAIEDYQSLSRFGMSPNMLSVNLSRKQFENGRIVDDVAQVLDMTGFEPSRLCLEITETALFRDSDSMHKILHELTALGANIAIDDFGVGYSSLLELRDYPISEVKIDRAFVMDCATSQSSQDIIKAIVDIAHSIGAEVVAEGIEDQQQFDTVKALGCHRAQGYFLCKPMPVTTFPDLLLGA
jgi:diguanylate cyclase (GGDEF)-like protein